MTGLPTSCARRCRTAIRAVVRFARAAIAAALLAGSAVIAPSAAADAGVPFRTRHAEFAPESWQALPGWNDESHRDAFAVFRASCQGLQRRAAWADACEQARAVGTGDEARAFFERTFVPYRVTPLSDRDPRLLTGYFEPVLDGSLRRGGRFLVPVLGPPDDLLHVDARRLPARAGGEPVRAYLDGREIVPVADAAAVPSGRSMLLIEPDALEDETLDRRFRVRLDGDRVRRYWSRAEIEAGRGRATPIAWVEDADALYVVQVQGSGRLRLPDGATLHLAYAEQNGHPFRPVATPPSGQRTRSIDPSPQEAVEPSSSMRSLVATDPQVQRVIDALLSPAARSPADRATGPATVRGAERGGPTAVTPPRRPDPAEVPPDPTSGAGRRDSAAMLARMAAARRVDPSYVYFRAVQGDRTGPVGALGVPLTAMRSIAVDPRVTPLGAPVFIESPRLQDDGPIRRLMFAHDTGGAIRGAVRGDFFWGTGPEAGLRAFRTRDPLSMWVLLPREGVARQATGMRARSITPDEPAECTLPDEAYC